MALDQSALLELAEMVRTADGGDLMRKLLETMLQSLVDAQATAHIGAEPHERSDARTTQRNGHRPKTVRTVSAAIVAPDSPPESVVTPPRLEPSPAAQGRDDDVPWYRSRGVRDSAIVAALVAVAGVATVAASRWL
jgi:hypothetical protein